MQALANWPAPSGNTLLGVFTDIDDTLTADGAITPDALQALADLKAAGLKVIPITGRPVGWSEPMAAHWPVDAIVAENGAVALLPPTSPARAGLNEKGLLSPPDQRWQLQKLYQQDTATRSANFARMQAVLQQIEQTVPGARRAEDSPGRETDIAIDHSEFTHLPQAAIDQAVAQMRAAGMNATVSSIHINGWFGAHNKLEGARWITQALFGRDLDAEMARWVYVGDSTNDQLMFQTFEHSFGVANIRRFEARLSHLPRYITPSERGSGFAEVARAILAARTGV
ncbi:HAD-IIB family hydrolase [Variovorax sp. HJSM1_2]|uniref:HAD-IIB family hydrolase n=1 Tax=Variovorax sp. HJSM1_2 TaxID=3366263 RepID=UPI003BC0D462